MHRITLTGETPETFDCAPGDVLLRAGLRAGLGLSYECSVGACGMCKFELLDGQVQTLRDDAPGLSERDRKKGRHLACQSQPQTDCTIRMRLEPACRPQAPVRRQSARLEAVQALTHDLREFRWRTAGPALFRPGQYAMLRFPALGVERAYSMSNLPNAEGLWCFQIRQVPGGQASHWLFEQARPGVEIGLDGPLGLAWLREDSPRDVVCLAGGSGLAPMLSIARGWAALAGAAPGRRLDFFYGGREPRDLCGEPQLRALAGWGGALHYHPVVSSEQAARQAGWSGPVGWVHEVMAQTLGTALSEREFYLAGPPPMTQAALALLQGGYGVPAERIHFDRFF